MPKPSAANRAPVAQPRDPNRSFVFFPKCGYTGRTARVGLESLIRQVEANLDRKVKRIYMDGEQFIIEWEAN